MPSYFHRVEIKKKLSCLIKQEGHPAPTDQLPVRIKIQEHSTGITLGGHTKSEDNSKSWHLFFDYNVGTNSYKIVVVAHICHVCPFLIKAFFQ